MACPHSTIRRRLRAVSLPLLAAALVSSCAVKAPPDTAAIKEQALPALQTPAQWAVTTVPGVGAVVEGWLGRLAELTGAQSIVTEHPEHAVGSAGPCRFAVRWD